MVLQLQRFVLFIFFVSILSAQSDSLYLAEHLVLGNPSGAEKNVLIPSNYLMVKKQYVLSYHRFNGTPNWVAWHTDSMWLGDIRRSNDFRADSAVPNKWYRVHEKSYLRSGYDRGHLCPSGDRTNTHRDNSMTFLMTNMIPQAPNNNRGPWADLEIYCRDLVKEGKELYVYCGGYGSKGFLDSGRVNIPERTWKVIVVLDAGENDINRITSLTRVIAVDMPNENAMIDKNDEWKKFRTSVDQIELLTGLDFLSAVPDSIQIPIERITDIR